jgi:hypothetical protein
LTLVAGVWLVLLAMWWTLGAFFFGSNEGFLIVMLFGYALSLALVGGGLILPPPIPRRLFILAATLPFVPIVALVLLVPFAAQSAPDPTAPHTDYTWLILFQLGPALLGAAAWFAAGRPRVAMR